MTSGRPWLQTGLSIEQRVERLLAEMTLAKKVGENTLRNVHLRPFKAAVEAGCGTVMAAFTDGVPMHAHRHLLREVLKDEWGFDGVVVADWDGVRQLVDQGVAADLREAATQAIAAGVDIDMVSGAYDTHLAGLVETGDLPLSLLDDEALITVGPDASSGVSARIRLTS